SFHVASTPRRFHKDSNQWHDLETNWFTVNAWRALGVNVAKSLQKGDPVVVIGKQTTNSYTDSNGRGVQSVVIEALAVGPDLNRGTCEFTKTSRNADNDEGVRTMNADLGVDGPQVSSDGELIEDMVVNTETGEIREESAA
ncbi:MAG TPA: single-stranded DNA-binding protein, partial [Nocardioides sp.]